MQNATQKGAHGFAAPVEGSMQNLEVGEIVPTSALGQVATPPTCPNLDPSFACPRCADAKAGGREEWIFCRDRLRSP